MENCRHMDAAVKPPSPVLVLSQHDVNVVIIILVVVAFIIVIQPLILTATFRKQGKTEAEVKNGAQSFFEIPYITWFRSLRDCSAGRDRYRHPRVRQCHRQVNRCSTAWQSVRVRPRQLIK